jgi:hypothetical protein
MSNKLSESRGSDGAKVEAAKIRQYSEPRGLLYAGGHRKHLRVFHSGRNMTREVPVPVSKAMVIR